MLDHWHNLSKSLSYLFNECVKIDDQRAIFCWHLSKCEKYTALKALLPVCMKYTTRDVSRVANIAWGKAECYICWQI